MQPFGHFYRTRNILPRFVYIETVFGHFYSTRNILPRHGKSPLKSSELSRVQNSALFWCFEKKCFLVKSWIIMLNFSIFSVGGSWGPPILLFWKLVFKKQIFPFTLPISMWDTLQKLVMTHLGWVTYLEEGMWPMANWLTNLIVISKNLINK